MALPAVARGEPAVGGRLPADRAAYPSSGAAGLHRNGWLVSVGITGCFASDYATAPSHKTISPPSGGPAGRSAALPDTPNFWRVSSMITADLAALLGTVRRPGDFFAAGTAELLAPLVEVEGVGPVALPLLQMQARQLIAAAEPAPYGRGAETVLDPAVRRCWQIGPGRGRIRGRHRAPATERGAARGAGGAG